MLRRILKRVFNPATGKKALPGGKAPVGDFERYLVDRFSKRTAEEIKKVLEKMQLPLPEKEDEFVRATDGALLFLNKYGVVVRIENDIDRPGNLPWILRPIGSVDAFDAIIEICPGCYTTDDEKHTALLEEELDKLGMQFVDAGAHNVGLLPVKLRGFPEGVPVVIDRPSVDVLSKNPQAIALALKRLKVKEDPQEKLYGALQKLFTEALYSSNTEEMQKFWASCADYKRRGILVSGWNEERQEKYKNVDAKKSARIYGQHFVADKKIQGNNR